MRTTLIVAAFTLLVSIFAPIAGASAEGSSGLAQIDPAAAFDRTWARTDLAVSEGVTSRTWMWGPQANTSVGYESYAEGQDGLRTVVYYDKSRMEIAVDPNVPTNSPWYVTNGLLALELMTGSMQYGNDTFQQYAPAEVNVAGDANDPTGPTYASLNHVMDAPPGAVGNTITQWIDRGGVTHNEESLGNYGVTVGYYVPETNHTVASVFWDFMNSGGLVWENGQYTQSALFESPFYATGYPVTEPYWAAVSVAGTVLDVLVQAFERRVLTYTPGNPVGFEVEAGNVGQHYFHWRYEVLPNGNSGGGTPIDDETITQYDLSEIDVVENSDDGYWGTPTSEGYAIDLVNGSGAIFWMNDQTFGDASYSVDIRVNQALQAGDACLDMRVGIREDSSITSDYMLCIYYMSESSGATPVVEGINLFYWNGDDYEDIASWDLANGTDAGTWHNLKMMVAGNQISSYFDGQLLGTAQHSGATSGYVGFSTYDYSDFDSDLVTVEFRDLMVSVAQ